MKKIIALMIMLSMIISITNVSSVNGQTIFSNEKNTTEENAQNVALNDNITGNLNDFSENHYYKVSVPKNKTIKLNIFIQGQGSNFVYSNCDCGMHSGGGMYVNGVRIFGDKYFSKDIKFGGKGSVYLNSGVYYLEVGAKDLLAHKDNVEIHSSGYLSYKYNITLSYDYVNDISMKENGPLLSDACLIELNKLYSGVQSISSYVLEAVYEGSEYNLPCDIYKFSVKEHCNINIQLKNYSNNKYHYIGVYKNLKNNGISLIKENKTYAKKYINGSGYITIGDTLSLKLDKGIYYVKFAFYTDEILSYGSLGFNGTSYQFKISATPLKKSISSLKYSKVTNKTYTGKQIKPSITVKDGKKTLKKGTDYTVSYGKNKNTGKATITIKGKGKYVGSKTITFYIVPKKVTISSVKPGKKQLTVKYKKVTGASGYQIAYSTSKSKGFKYITINSKRASKVIKKLKSKKKYYVKVRAYKTVGKKKYYGAYSNIKNVKVK